MEITPTARYAKDLYDWAMTGHNQNGTHKAFTETAIVPTAAIQDGAVSTAKIANNGVTVIRLNATETTDFASPLAIPATTWTDLKGNQNFTVDSTSSVIQVSIVGSVGIGTAAGNDIAARIVIDSAGTSVTRHISGMQTPTSNTGYPKLNFGTVFITGLSAGTHTIKTQVYAAVATQAYCRPVLAPNTEFFTTSVVEYKK